MGGSQGLQDKGESSGERRKNYPFPREKPAGVGRRCTERFSTSGKLG